MSFVHLRGLDKVTRRGKRMETLVRLSYTGWYDRGEKKSLTSQTNRSIHNHNHAGKLRCKATNRNGIKFRLWLSERNKLSIKTLHRFTCAINVHFLGGTWWILGWHYTTESLHSHFLPKLRVTSSPLFNLGSDTFIFVFSSELHSCLNILYTSNFTMKSFVTFQGSASLSSLGLN